MIFTLFNHPQFDRINYMIYTEAGTNNQMLILPGLQPTSIRHFNTADIFMSIWLVLKWWTKSCLLQQLPLIISYFLANLQATPTEHLSTSDIWCKNDEQFRAITVCLRQWPVSNVANKFNFTMLYFLNYLVKETISE